MPVKQKSFGLGVVGAREVGAGEMGHGRTLTPLDELKLLPLAVGAKLLEVEILALILYTGPPAV